MNRILKGKIVEKFGSSYEFARVVGVHETDVSRIIHGRRELTQDSRKKWADVLCDDVGRLFPAGCGGEEAPRV